MRLVTVLSMVVVLACGAMLVAQSDSRPLSSDGTASVHVLGRWERTEREQFTLGGERYVGGDWIDIAYGRPLLRGREAFTGTDSDYGKTAYAGAPVWRAGANLSTRLRSTVPLEIGDTLMPAGEYSLFIELNSPSQWTFIVSDWAQAQRFDAPVSEGLYGAFGYTPEKDIVRAPMRVETLPYQVEQLTWMFTDMVEDSGRMAILWDTTMASVPFRLP